MSFTLPELPYSYNALLPYISEETINLHYNKHHRGYVDKLNLLTINTEFEKLTNKNLPEIIQKTYGKSEFTKIFNNAGQVWNHTFYWNSMKNNGGGKPTDESLILQKINQDLGSIDNFAKLFTEYGENQFGSGWVWLVYDNHKKLNIISTSNAESPLVYNQTPLLTMDVWEHAYYVDRKNARAQYIKIFIDNLINWEFAEKNLQQAI